jgi:uncharacterized membrane protein HdeD (DUF308 family)
VGTRPAARAGGDGSVTGFAVRLGPEELRRARRWLLISGILSLIAGALAIAVPAAASVTIAIFIGWILVVAGVMMGIHAASERDRGDMALRMLNAVLALAIGVYILVAPLSGTLTLTFLLAAWFLASGALLLILAFRERALPGAWLAGLNGVVSLILGLLIAVDLPSSANWAIGLLVGINLLFWGVRALVGASLIKSALDGWTSR